MAHPNKKFSLTGAIDFHGHLGPYLVLGLKAGDLALKELKLKKYFGLRVEVFGFDKKPKSCIIDGLQLSTGATFGKGNIKKYKANLEKIVFFDLFTKEKLSLMLKTTLKQMLSRADNHRRCEILARKLFKANPKDLFDIEK